MEQVRAQEQDGLVLFQNTAVAATETMARAAKTKDPLQGNLSVNQLTHYIDKTMPEDDPSQVTGESARDHSRNNSFFFIPLSHKKNRESPTGTISAYSATDA